MFDVQLRYRSQIRGQHRTKTVEQIEKLQVKDIKIINFKSKNDSSNPLYKSMKIFKLNEEVLFQSCMFAFKKHKF